MLIDWFTVIAQVLNFLILAWLLKRFLYRPILDAIDAREHRIATELADADKKSAESERQQDKFKKKNAAFDTEKEQRNNNLTAEIKTERARLFAKVREETDRLRDKLQLALKNDQLILQVTLSQRVREEVFAIVGKVLKDLADTNLEARITAVFIQHFQKLSHKELAGFKSAVQQSGSDVKSPLIIRSAFTFSKEQCALIEAAIKNIFCHHTTGEHSVEKNAEDVINGSDSTHDKIVDQIALKFVIDPTVISGIEINVNGQKVAWSIGDYLNSFAKGVDEILQSLGNEQSIQEDNNEGDDVITPKAILIKTEQGSHEK